MASSALDRIIRELVEDEGDSSEDFDRRIADLIVAEAKEKNRGHAKQSKSSLESSSRRHTTNTRFLNNVVRGVQSHNRAVLSSSSAEVEQRPDRSLEARGSAHDTDQGGERESRMRGWSDDEDDHRAASSRHVTPGGNSERRSHRHRNTDKEEQISHRRKHSTRERDREEDRHRRKRSQSPRRHKSRSETHTTKSEMEAGPSKMDRYFDDKYDPMLDVRAETRTDENGLIEDDGWERMLQAVKDKEERKRARKEGKGHRHEKQEALRVGADVMQTQYTSRGKLREWDKGKEDPRK